MGVADNKSYKDQYHFNSKWFKQNEKQYPSIRDEDKINSTIKENPERSNVEIEGNEIVLQPDLSALFKAVGKKHSNGGMDVLLKPDSFIFSDDKSLAFTEGEHDIFEFKKGGNFKPKKNTPAEVLKRNVDVKHYNTLVNNVGNRDKDDLAKKSSIMMLEKYIQTLGNIAYVQEEKKDFPDGLPHFSIGTAPVYNPEVEENVEASKQYAKYGGTVMDMGGTLPDRCPCGKDAKGNCLPCTTDQIDALMKKATRGTIKDVTGMNKIGTSGVYDLYHVGTDPSSMQRQTPGPKMSDDKWRQFIKTPQGQAWLKRYKASTPGTDKLVSVGNPIDLVHQPSFSEPPRVTDTPECECDMDRFGQCLPCGETTPLDTITPGTVTGSGNGYKSVDWQFTPWQKISQMYNWGQFANVKRYMPYRSRYDATYMEPALLNEQQAVGTAKGIANQQIGALTSVSPILRNAQAAATTGQLLDQLPQIQLAVENQNVGIKNQARQYNNQVKNQETMVNMQNDQNYYKEAIIGRQNFDNMRTYTANNAMNNVLRDVEANQKLAYNQLTLNNPAYTFDFRTGNFVRNMNKNIMDVQGRLPEDTWNKMVGEVQQLKRLGLSDQVISTLVRGRLFQQAAPYFQQSQTPPPFGYKKGGRYRGK